MKSQCRCHNKSGQGYNCLNNNTVMACCTRCTAPMEVQIPQQGSEGGLCRPCRRTQVQREAKRRWRTARRARQAEAVRRQAGGCSALSGATEEELVEVALDVGQQSAVAVTRAEAASLLAMRAHRRAGRTHKPGSLACLEAMEARLHAAAATVHCGKEKRA